MYLFTAIAIVALFTDVHSQTLTFESSATGARYFFDQLGRNFTNAVSWCNYLDAQVVQPSALAEAVFFNLKIQQTMNEDPFKYWIGAKSVDNSTEFPTEWLSGAPITKYYWARDEPKHLDTDCKTIFISKGNIEEGLWYLADCETELMALCEAKTTKNSIPNNLNDIKDSLGAMLVNMTTVGQKLADLQNTANRLDAKLSDLQFNASTLNDEVSGVANNVNEVQEHLKEDMSTLNESISAFKDELTKLHVSLHELDTDFQTEASVVKSNLTDIQSDTKDLQASGSRDHGETTRM